jgi:hypothetical protein
MSSQKHRVLNHLKDGKFLNQLVATNEYGILRLPARICELRQDGHFIKTIMREVHNRFGEKTRVANYILEQRK